jgi:hypothetical protein
MALFSQTARCIRMTVTKNIRFPKTTPESYANFLFLKLGTGVSKKKFQDCALSPESSILKM